MTYVTKFQQFFEVRNPDRVRSYIKENPHVVEFIELVYDKVTMYFPPPLRCALEVYEWGTPLLHFIIITGLRHSEADKIFEDFDRGWWHENSPPHYDELALDMEYGRIAEDV